MSDWNSEQESPRVSAIKGILTRLDANDAEYLSEAKTRDEWVAESKLLDERLGVVGLRLAVRPWVR